MVWSPFQILLLTQNWNNKEEPVTYLQLKAKKSQMISHYLNQIASFTSRYQVNK